MTTVVTRERPVDAGAGVGWLAIPALSARALGQFRVVFGLLLFYAVLRDAPETAALTLHRNYSWLADFPLVHAVAASPDACRILHVASLGVIALFIVGFWTRLAYAGVVALLLFSRLVDLQSNGTHDWVLTGTTLLALLIVPWGDGFSIDAVRRREPDREQRSGQLYGLAVWLPGLTLGLALAAAAYAKLTTSGLAWITSGAVRYHFVEDANIAPVTWGLWVAAHPAAAVVLSLGAIVVEGAFIANVVLRTTARLIFGLSALLFFFGSLYVFQGHFWLPWALWLVVFLPWPWLDRGRPVIAHDAASLRPRHFVVIGVLVLQQVLASATATEIEPVISHYPMYAGTYDSPEHFERFRARKLRQLVFLAGAEDVTSRVDALQQASNLLARVADTLSEGGAIRERDAVALAALRAEYRARYGTDLSTITVLAEHTPFDWTRGAFRPLMRTRLADIPLGERPPGSE